MLLGYARVSTADQTLDLQRDALLEAGCERVYADVASGARTERPELARLLESARDGDVLVVWKLDRVGRSLKHLVGLVAELEQRGVGLRVLQDPVDTTTPSGRLIFHLFGALAEFERSLIQERTQAGLAAARARGRTGGRPRKMTKAKLRAAMAMMADPENQVAQVAAELGIARSTLYMYVRGDGRPTPAAAALLEQR